MRQRRLLPMRGTQLTRLAATGAVVLGAVPGCGWPAETFSPVTPQGRSIADLFLVALAISALILALVGGLLIQVLRRYRARPGDAEPPQVEGNRKLELAWTLAPFLVLAVIFWFTVRTMRAVDADPGVSPGVLQVQVVGHQWWWEFRYPDLGVVTANELHAPVGVPLRLQLQSADVVHSFWVPQLGWKRDAVPGKTNVLSLRVDQPGVYDGTCAEFCGVQHAWMRIRFVAQPREQFDAWAQQQRLGSLTAAATPADAQQASLVARGQQVFLTNTCVNCHTIQGTAATGTVGPDLTHVGSRTTLGAGVIQNTPADMRRWVQDARAVKPGALMPPFALSDADLDALVAYLEGLE